MSHSKGYDGISIEHLKLINKDLSKCFTLIINKSLNSGIFPDVQVTTTSFSGEVILYYLSNIIYRPISRVVIGREFDYRY